MSNWFKSLFGKKDQNEVSAPVVETPKTEPAAESAISTPVEKAPQEEAKVETQEKVEEPVKEEIQA